jgi:hypothetical protein
MVEHPRASARRRRRPDGAVSHQGPLSALAELLASEPDEDLFERLRSGESIGRPLGGDRFLSRIERLTGRELKPGERGPKPQEAQGR